MVHQPVLPANTGRRPTGVPGTSHSGLAVTELHWLPVLPDWRARLRQFAADPSWENGIALANARLDFVLTNALDTTLRNVIPRPPSDLTTKPVRLAILGSSTLAHLLPAIRIAGLRRGIWIDTFETEYGQYLQALSDPGSGLRDFAPTAILLALDAHHLTAGISTAMDPAKAEQALADVMAHIRTVWKLARDTFQCPVLHQTALPVHPSLLGNNEHRLLGSRAAFVSRLNVALRELSDVDAIDLLPIDDWSSRDGLRKWHDAGLWHRSKQEITPTAAPFYGDLVGRWVAARQGRSAKCLVLDLDNTLWGGVIGDDGLDGIVLGQGSPLGEAYVAFQRYARDLAERGIILAVCTKNDEANALEPFERHPDMMLKRSDIASFVANWSAKPDNIRTIAHDLNIGLDSLVFVDDNPFERDLVRQELPMVAVPDISDDPANFPNTLSSAGYFEGLSVTDEDRQRTSLYQGNQARDALKTSAVDLPAYLRALGMELTVRDFDRTGLQRIVQLINKSNQFNLTTKRYTDEDVRSVMSDPEALGLQLRLTDRFGDNGVIAIVIGRFQVTQTNSPARADRSSLPPSSEPGREIVIDTWLMSCRVLGRQVERATLNVIVNRARRLGALRLLGQYIPTKKNGMVKDHYKHMGFELIETTADGGSRNVLDVGSYVPTETFIRVVED
jgi:FkbH-like protein